MDDRECASLTAGLWVDERDEPIATRSDRVMRREGGKLCASAEDDSSTNSGEEFVGDGDLEAYLNVQRMYIY